MATLIENAAAVKSAATAIDAAIVAKGGTTEGGLNNAAAAIAALPSGGEPEYPLPWKNDGKTHLWWYFGPNAYPFASFSAQYISDGHTFEVDWGDGKIETVAASAAAYTTRTLTHMFDDTGIHEVVVSGYDAIKINQSPLFGSYTSGTNASSVTAIRQVEIGGVMDESVSSTFAATGLIAVKFSNAPKSFTGAAFRYCTSLAVVENLSLVQSAPQQLFWAATSLVSINDFSALTNIPHQIFSNCNSLVSVGDFSSVTSIGSSAFSSCASLTDIYFRSISHVEVEAISGLAEIPGRVTCVLHCSDGDFYRSGSSLLPVPTEG